MRVKYLKSQRSRYLQTSNDFKFTAELNRPVCNFTLAFLFHQYFTPISMNKRTLASRKRIALVAHDNMKDEIIEWAVYNKTALSKHILYATGTTGRLLE